MFKLFKSKHIQKEATTQPTEKLESNVVLNIAKSDIPPQPTPTNYNGYYGSYGNYGNLHFDGQKNFRTLGLPLMYDIDYYGMANRAWNLYLTTDITKIVIDRLTQFAVGDGLKLQYEPDKTILKKKYNINIDTDFTKYVESIWGIYCNSKYVSNNNQSDIHTIAITVMINTLLCGDCLIIRRVKDGIVKLQVIDGRDVCGGIPTNTNNKVIDGVEINQNGEHVAYYVATENGTNERITAKDSKGNTQAWLVYANNSRISQVRGVSSICSIIQKIDQLSKYTENEVTASEVNSKLATVIEHTDQSDGKNPILVGRELVKSTAYNPELEDSTKQAILKLTNGLLINLGVGKTMKSFDTKRPNVNFEAFLDANAKYIFASQNIPFEIAVMLFSNNFSASRAALKMFETTLKIMRKNIVIDGIYKPTFKTFFLLENLKGNLTINNFDKIQNSPEYQIDMNALNKCRFISPPIPHVDPLKEVNAVVEKIKNNLSTREEAMEELGNSTDFDSTIERIDTENQLMKKFNIKDNTEENAEDKNTNENSTDDEDEENDENDEAKDESNKKAKDGKSGKNTKTSKKASESE
ncbi:MAG TPA: phage portal protein [Rickettsiales bacterium]|nr:phage portal protein [Rickettsiales bacterium]